MSNWYKWAYILTGKEIYKQLYLQPYQAIKDQQTARPSEYLRSITGAKDVYKPKDWRNSMNENYYDRQEREASEELEALLAKPVGNIWELDVESDDEVFDPWAIFPLYGNYSSEFDDMAIQTLENILNGNQESETLAHEMFREMLCKKGLCDYGTSPRVCFPSTQFRKLLPEYIKKWKEYYKLTWRNS